MPSETASPSSRRRSGELFATVRRRVGAAPRALLILLVAAILLRIFTMVVYSTIVDDYYTGDAGRFMRINYSGVFEDEWQPAGYALFLAGIHAITSQIAVTVAVQHLLGLLTGLLLYATARRAGAGPRLALVPAIVSFFSADQLFLEQTILTETVWIALLAGALYTTVRGGIERRWTWLAAGGALLGLSIIVRNVSLPLPVVFAAWAVFVAGATPRERIRAGLAALVPAIVVVLGYILIATSIGSYSGMGEMSGWSLYERVGQFADCSKFTPPEGTRGFCEERPPAERPGPFYYYFDPSAPGRQVFPGGAPADSDTAGEFAKAAILNQPGDYLRTVVKDVVRYFDPTIGTDRPLSGSPPDSMAFRQAPASAADRDQFVARVRTKYDGIDATPDSGTALLELYDAVLSVNSMLLVALLTLTALAVLRARGPARATAILVGATAVVLLVLPPMVSSYDARYTIPPSAFLAVSAAFGLATIVPTARRKDARVGGERAATAPSA